jgi:hypothetical protein
MRSFILAWSLTLPLITAGDDIPVGDVKKEDLAANLASIRAAWLETEKFPPRSLFSMTKVEEPDEAQRQIDQDVAILVTINPESRVKVHRGPAAIQLDLGWPTLVLVKVLNEGGVTAQLNVRILEDTAVTARVFEFTSLIDSKRMLTPKLSGRHVEYQLLLLRSSVRGRRELKLSFDVGQATQDLGMRAELPVLVDTLGSFTAFYADKADLLWTEDRDGRRNQIKDAGDWRSRKWSTEHNFMAVAGVMIESKRKFFDIQENDEVVLDKVIRQSITYRTRDGDRVPAYVFLPKVRKGPIPAVLCLHQTTKLGKAEPAGLGGLKNLHYALELAERGYVTIAPDYPGYGEYKDCDPYKLKYDSATAKGIINHRAALDVLESMPEVDKSRIGCIGHSLGGHNTLFVSLFDDRIKVLATSCGFCSFPKYMGGDLKGWSHKGYMPRIASVYQCDPKQMPFDFTEILASMAPRPVFINAPLKDTNFAVDGVRDCVKAARPVYQLFGKPDHLVVEHPDCGHDFPLDVRERCYQFFDRYLRDRADSK